MPIPGPAPAVYAAEVLPTGSPWWLSVNGVWLQIEGVVPSTTAEVDRPRSSMVSLDGHRFEQRSKFARRSWSWSMPHAISAHVAALVAAADSDADVWLMSDAVAGANMLPTRSCFGTVLPALDCGGVPLGTFAGTEVLAGRVRGGVATTLSAWTTAATGGDVAAEFDYPGAVGVELVGDPSGRASANFTPTEDGALVIRPAAGFRTSGVMVTEGEPADTWIPGESMPCKVVIDDLGDVLTMLYAGTWRHDYTVNLREVG